MYSGQDKFRFNKIHRSQEQIKNNLQLFDVKLLKILESTLTIQNYEMLKLSL